MSEIALHPFKAALEGVGAVFKNGRNTDKYGNPLGARHRTPFEVMAHVALADQLGKDDEQAQRGCPLFPRPCLLAREISPVVSAF
jgi:hypothetical protein